MTSFTTTDISLPKRKVVLSFACDNATFNTSYIPLLYNTSTKNLVTG